MPGPVRPANPVARSAAPEPAAGAAATAPEGYHAYAQDDAETTAAADDDDAVIVPPPPMEYLGHTHPHHPPGRPGVKPRYESLGYKQTVIPVLLTTGVCLLALAATKFLLPPDTALGNMHVIVAGVLILSGIASLAFGVLTMLQVKHVLDARTRADAETTGATGEVASA